MKHVSTIAVAVLLCWGGSSHAAELTPSKTPGLTGAPGVIKRADQRFANAATKEVPSFQRHVLPLMGRLGCNGRACHGSFQGQGGFRLSLFGYDFKMDYDALTKSEEPRVDLKKPRESLMLTKPTSNDDEHGGGKRMDVDSWQYRVLLRWVEAGAPPTKEGDAEFVRLEVSPLEVVFKKQGEKARLRVLSHWSDGSVEDVTPLCRFTTNDEAVAKVDLSGEITVVGTGDTHIVAFYDNGVVPVSALLPVTDKAGPKYPSTPTPTKVDELVVNKLRKLGVVPSETCTDHEFLRRASLDITGALPTATEVTSFLSDSSSDKRTRKIDELLNRPAYAAWWATKLSDILGNNEGKLRNQGGVGSQSEQWYQWTVRRIAENAHYDDLVAGIVLAKGRTSSDQSFEDYCRQTIAFGLGNEDVTERATMPHYWARQNMRTSNEKALSFSYAFLGVRLQCAECHKHPFDQWSQTDFQQFTAFFNRVTYGPTDRSQAEKMLAAAGIDKKLPNNERQKLLKKAIDAGKIVPQDEVYITASKSGARRGNDKGKNTGAGRVITPKVLGGDEVVDAQYDDPRQPLMDWLRQKDNPYFAKALVNRVWAHYFNVGIVEPADDMNLANAPSNKELLEWLASSFIEHDFDLKWLHRTIVGSRTYQLSWQTNSTNELDLRNFSHAVPRRMPAEVVYDAVVTATAGESELAKRADEPATVCAIGMSRGYTQRNNGNNYALTVFGKPKRETPCDCERSNEPSLLQTVYLRNDKEMFSFISRSNGWLQDALKRLPGSEGSAKADGGKENPKQGKKGAKSEPVVQATPADVIREAYLRTFSRFPTDQELANAEKYLVESSSPADGLNDLVWALLNSKEFLVNH